jgi:tetratricopeptide (TPR) repeat protein
VAYRLARGGHIERSLNVVESLVAEDPGDTPSRRLLAWSLNRVGRHEEALRHYRDLVEEQPHDSEMHAGLGDGLLSLGQHAEAPGSHCALGWALLLSGHADESRRSFDRAIELATGPSDMAAVRIDARAGRCGALSALGDHGTALKEFEEVLRNVPDYLDDDPELRPFIVASRQAVKG